MLRLRERATGAFFVVDTAAGKVYADTGAGRIGRENELGTDLARSVLASARGYLELFELAVPGNTTADGAFELRGALTRGEQQALDQGRSVAAERPALLLHLDFFDRDLDGRISLAENYASWRALGFSAAAALGKTALAAVIFGRITAGFAIDVECIGERRYGRGTGIYDDAGRIDRPRLDALCAAFRERGGRLGFEEALALLRESSNPGFLSRRQFRSLFCVCTRLNKGARVVTEAQFRGLFDGSLLWLAASATNDAGRAPTGYRAAAPAGSPR